MQFEGLDGGLDVEAEVPIFQAASQEYRHEYSGHRRQKVFNDSVHGEGADPPTGLCMRLCVRVSEGCAYMHLLLLQATFSCTGPVWPS